MGIQVQKPQNLQQYLKEEYNKLSPELKKLIQLDDFFLQLERWNDPDRNVKLREYASGTDLRLAILYILEMIEAANKSIEDLEAFQNDKANLDRGFSLVKQLDKGRPTRGKDVAKMIFGMLLFVIGILILYAIGVLVLTATHLIALPIAALVLSYITPLLHYLLVPGLVGMSVLALASLGTGKGVVGAIVAAVILALSPVIIVFTPLLAGIVLFCTGELYKSLSRDGLSLAFGKIFPQLQKRSDIARPVTVELLDRVYQAKIDKAIHKLKLAENLRLQIEFLSGLENKPVYLKQLISYQKSLQIYYAARVAYLQNFSSTLHPESDSGEHERVQRIVTNSLALEKYRTALKDTTLTGSERSELEEKIAVLNEFFLDDEAKLSKPSKQELANSSRILSEKNLSKDLNKYLRGFGNTEMKTGQRFFAFQQSRDDLKQRLRASTKTISENLSTPVSTLS